MKLVSLNVGIRISNSSEIVDFLKTQDADIVTLQEVSRHLEDSVSQKFRSKRDIEDGLSDIYPYSFFGPTWVAEGFKNASKPLNDFGGHIEQGCQILSKRPIISGSNEFYYGHFKYMQDWSKWEEEDHGRALLITRLEIDDQEIQILNLHGIWTKDKLGDERTKKQCEYIVQAAQRSDLPTIIAGDINLLPDSESLAVLNNQYRNLVSETGAVSSRPDFKDEVESGGGIVDYIFVNDKIKVNSFEIASVDISDHYPQILEFEIA